MTMHRFYPAIVTTLLISNVAFCDQITVRVSGNESADGQIIARLFDKADAFPKDFVQEAKSTVSENGVTQLVFKNLEPGLYGVMVVHDEDGNNKMSTNFLGLPKEAVGASNNVRPKFGPPNWKDIQFRLEQTPVELNIKVAPIF